MQTLRCTTRCWPSGDKTLVFTTTEPEFCRVGKLHGHCCVVRLHIRCTRRHAGTPRTNCARCIWTHVARQCKLCGQIYAVIHG